MLAMPDQATPDPATPARFVLDPRLAADTVAACDLPLSRLLVMDDARFPWAILVPRLAGAREIVDLSDEEAALLLVEIRLVSAALRRIAPCDKLNVGALGNLVPQLHVHIVARRTDDAAWPGPVWGSGPRQPYPKKGAGALAEGLARALADGAEGR